jgi:hypothetical protein
MHAGRPRRRGHQGRALEGDSFRELPGFFGWNRGKRSIAVNLKTPEGRRIVQRLAERADVVMENMRPGVAERLGVGYERLSASIRAHLLLGHRVRLDRSRLDRPASIRSSRRSAADDAPGLRRPAAVSPDRAD